ETQSAARTYPRSLHDALPISRRAWRPAAVLRLRRGRKVVRVLLEGQVVDRDNAGARPSQREKAVGRVEDLAFEEYPDDFAAATQDRKSTRLNSSHDQISYAVF